MSVLAIGFVRAFGRLRGFLGRPYATHVVQSLSLPQRYGS